MLWFWMCHQELSPTSLRLSGPLGTQWRALRWAAECSVEDGQPLLEDGQPLLGGGVGHFEQTRMAKESIVSICI